MRPYLAALVLALATLLGACASKPVLRPHPPSRLVEVRPASPGTVYHWVEGHYQWDRAQQDYRRIRGRWEARPQGHRLIPGRYVLADAGAFRVKKWLPGRWVAVRAAARRDRANPRSSVTTKLPDHPHPRAPRGSIQPQSPGDGFVWLRGHYAWRDARYRWVSGRWTPAEPRKTLIPGFYRWVQKSERRIQAWVPARWD